MDDSLEQLIARSRSPGNFVERRRFTLSREKAIEKQRAFALRDPKRYILELVQSAVHAQASFIAVDVHYEHVLVAFVGGRTVGVGELSQLFDYLFSDRGDPETRHLIQLAVGVNALLKLKPYRIRIESGVGDRAARMDVNARGEVRVGEPHEPIAGTYVFAQLRSSFFKRFSDVKVFPEQALIEERCIHTPVPILINGSAPFGYRIRREVDVFPGHHQHPFDTDERYGVIALPKTAGFSPGFKVVMGGTWITTLQLPELGEVRMRGAGGRWVRQPFFGVICDDTLRKTADQSDVVRDRRFQELLRALRPMARNLARQVSEDADYIGAAEDEALALPVRIPVLGQPEPLPARALRELPTEEPVFWVSPDETNQIEAIADPSRLHARVLVLREAEVEDLAELRPDLTLHRLSRAADVDFALRLLTRSGAAHEVVVERPEGRLTLRLHLEGPRPGWGHGEGVPFLAHVSGVTTQALRLDADLPGVSVSLALPAQGVPASATVRSVVLGEVWRLLPDAPADADATLRLVRALAQPPFTSAFRLAAPEGAQRLGVLFPAAWSQAARQRVLEAPLEEGGRCLQDALEGPVRDALGPGLGALSGLPLEEAPPGLDPDALQRLFEQGEAAPGWLSAVEVDLPGVRGWLGLRDHLPLSPAVVFWRGTATSDLPALRRLPVQGLLVGEEDAPTPELLLASLELYARLLPALASSPSAAAREHARWYVAQADEQDALRAALSQALGEATSPPSLPSARPPAELAARLRGALTQALAEARCADKERPEVRVTLSASPARWPLSRPPALTCRAADSFERELNLQLNLDHPAAEAARAGGQAETLLLLDAARVLATCAWRAWGMELELEALQRALIARRVTPGASAASSLPPDASAEEAPRLREALERDRAERRRERHANKVD